MATTTGATLRRRLTGYDETPSISTHARGSFEASIEDGKIEFRLRYEGLEGGNASAAHVHLGQRHTAGGVSAFLCGGGGQAACPAGNADIKGEIVAANVIGPSGQGIAAGQFDELVAAIRAGAVYANVHTPTYPNGEIRVNCVARAARTDTGRTTEGEVLVPGPVRPRHLLRGRR